MTTVLLVEDDADVAAALTYALEDEGYQVATTLGSGALALARSLQPAVVLLDINMPGVDGVAVARQLRADEATQSIPIVLMSAGFRLRERARDAPVDAMLAKPFDLAALLECVDAFTRAGD